MRYLTFILLGLAVGACGNKAPIEPAQNQTQQKLPKSAAPEKPPKAESFHITGRADIDPNAEVERREKHYSTGKLLCEFEVVADVNGNEIMHGKYTSFWGNGQMFESGAFDKGERIGTWQRWYSNGKPVGDTAVATNEK